MTSLATKYMENKAKKYAKGRAAEVFNPTLQYVNDPEILAAQEEAAKTKQRWWWKKQSTPDIILSERDRQVLKAVKRRATYLDKGCTCCCFTFGFDFIIGLIPGIGDAIGLILGLELIKVASRADLPKHLQIQMFTNVMIDFLVGLAPLVGDILDAVIKSNWRNAMLLEDYLMLRRRDELRSERGLAKDEDQRRFEHYEDDDLGNGAIQISSPESQPAKLTGPYQQNSNHRHHMYSPEAESSSSPPPTTKDEKYGTFLPRF